MNLFFKDLFNVPNTLSLFRLAASPLLAAFWLWFGWFEAGLALGTLSGITDLLDGVLARKLNQMTDLGAMLDQLGDLLFESTCLIIAVIVGEMWLGWLLIYLFREFTVTVIRTYVLSRGGTLESSAVGKAKSNYFGWGFFFFFLGVIVIERGLVPESYNMVGVEPGRFLIWVAMMSIITGIIMGLYSGFVYLRSFAHFYVEQNHKGSLG